MCSKFGYAFVGCGYIAELYAQDLATYPGLMLVGTYDTDAPRARALAGRFGGEVYRSLAELLADTRVNLVVNLTAHRAHYEITAQCLAAGKHVHSEKPLAMTRTEARMLLRLAETHGVRLSCAPFTFMGEAQQTAGSILRSGVLGTLRLIYADVNAGRVETWHPMPQSFYDAGPLFDVGGYALAIILSFLGPAHYVSASGAVVAPERKTLAGVSFPVQTPDVVVAMIELHAGPLVRLTTSFYPSPLGKHGGIEFHGDQASLYLSSSLDFNARVELAEYGKAYDSVPYIRTPQPNVRWGAAVADLANAILAGHPHRASGELAAHIVEILSGATESMQMHRAVELTSGFAPPAPMEWAV